MIKLFVSDIDGTLLNEKHQLNKETIEAIHELSCADIRFVVASGRNYRGIQFIMNEFKKTNPCIALNGGDGRDQHGNKIFDHPIEADKVEQIFDIIKENNFTVEYYCVDGDYTQLDLDEINDIYIENFQSMFQLSKQEAAIFVKELDMPAFMQTEKDFQKLKEHQPIKIEFHLQNGHQKSELLNQLEKIGGLHLTSSAPFNIEITHECATKGNMVLALCDYYNIQHDEVVVIGDSANDLSMFQLFEHSYAMENANDEVKKYANHIAPSNAENGVAHIIRKIISQNKEES